jgi:hypothetical protein
MYTDDTNHNSGEIFSLTSPLSRGEELPNLIVNRTLNEEMENESKKQETERNVNVNTKSTTEQKKNSQISIPNTEQTVTNEPQNSMRDSVCPPLQVPTLRANDCSTTKYNFRVYSHNVNGLRDETKLEYIPRIMGKKSH